MLFLASTISGVMKILIHFSLFKGFLLVNNIPRIGISPKRGILSTSCELELLINPPKIIVDWFPITTFVLIDFSVKLGIPSTVFAQSI